MGGLGLIMGSIGFRRFLGFGGLGFRVFVVLGFRV